MRTPYFKVAILVTLFHTAYCLDEVSKNGVRRSKRQTNADQMVQNILQWLQGLYTENSRKIRQGTFREYLPPSNTQKPRPFGYPPAGSVTPEPPFPVYTNPTTGAVTAEGYSPPTGDGVQPPNNDIIPPNQQPDYNGYRPSTQPQPSFTFPGSTLATGGFPGTVTPPAAQTPEAESPGYPTKLPGGPTVEPGFPTPLPGGSTIRPGFSTQVPGVSTIQPGYPSVVPGGSTIEPEFPSLVPGGSTIQPGYPSLVPGGSTIQPGYPSLVPGGSTIQPGYPSLVPGGSTIQPGFPTQLPGGSTVNPGVSTQEGEPTVEPGYPTQSPVGPSTGLPDSGPNLPIDGSTVQPESPVPSTERPFPTDLPGFPTRPPTGNVPDLSTQPPISPTSQPGYPTSPPSGYPNEQPSGIPTEGSGSPPDQEGPSSDLPGFPTRRPEVPEEPAQPEQPTTETEAQTTEPSAPGYSTIGPAEGSSPSGFTTGRPEQPPNGPSTIPSAPESPPPEEVTEPSYVIPSAQTPSPDGNTIPPGQPSESSPTERIPTEEDLKHPPHIHAIDVQCAKDMMTINIEFNRPFDGVIYSKGYYANPDCRYVQENTGKTKYSFTVSLNSCGTEFIDAFDTQGQSYLENILVLQNEPGIQEVWDTIRSVRCLWEGNLKESLSVGLSVGMLNQEIITFSGDTAMAKLDVVLGRGPFGQPANGLVKIGEQMTLVVSVSGDPGFDIQVKDCRATDSSGTNTIQLTDDDGCVLKQKLFGAFQKTRDTGNTGASIIAYAYFNAFKFPDVMDLMIECNIELCKTDCEMCSQQDQALEPSKRRKRDLVSRNQTHISNNDGVVMSKHLMVILPEDLSPETAEVVLSNSKDTICMTLHNFVVSSAFLISLLISSCLFSVYLWLKNNRMYYKK